MKRITSKHKRDKNLKRNQLILGLALAFVMFSSVIGYAFQLGTGVDTGDTNDNDGNQIVYNGIEFNLINGFWTAGSFSFRHNPEEIQYILPNLEGLKDGTFYRDLPLYVSSQDLDSDAEIKVNLGQIAGDVSSACIEGELCEGNLPVKSCKGEENIIIVKMNDSRSIRQEGNCVFIEGPIYELAQLTDRFLFDILGII
ncbi:MAG: hypothetical protein Q8P81_03130 [Nanoarchaeota archaeon]|nr:hypothetical protein [Nanoarchaeota archaeon]